MLLSSTAEPGAVISAISTVGFPIVAALLCGLFIWKMSQQYREDYNKQVKAILDAADKREDKMYQQLNNFSESLDKFNETLVRIDTRLEVLEKKNS